MAPILHHHPAPPPDLYPSQPGTQALAHAGDQGMAVTYQEENYEDYGEYEAEQEYGDNMGVDMANKGRNANPSDYYILYNILCINYVQVDEILQLI